MISNYGDQQNQDFFFFFFQLLYFEIIYIRSCNLRKIYNNFGKFLETLNQKQKL